MAVPDTTGQSVAPPDYTPESQPELWAPALLPRMGSWVYEGLLLFGVVFIAGYLFGTLTQTRHAMNNRLGLQAFLFGVLGIYFVWFWRRGQTLAMKTWRIRVVDAHGGALTQQRAMLRYLLIWIWCVPPLLAAYAASLTVAGTSATFVVWVAAWAALSHFHPLKQFWHDEWAGTRLVDYRPAG